MDSPSGPLVLAFVFTVFLLAGFIKGVIGLGLPTIAVGLLSTVLPPAQAAAILIVPSFFTNVWQMVGPGLLAISHRLWTMMVGVCVGTYAGAGLLVRDTAGHAATALGLALIVYAGVGLAGVRFSVHVRYEPWLSPLVGAATGLVTGATGVFVIPAVPYIQALGFEKDDLVRALGLSFLVSTVALGFSLISGGMLATFAGTSAWALVPALGGMMLGQIIRAQVSAARFRLCFFWGLLLLGGHLVVRSFL